MAGKNGKKKPSLAVIILAAGEGVRMVSKTPKVLHPLAGKRLIYFPVSAALSLEPEAVVLVVGRHKPAIEEYISGEFNDKRIKFAVQKTPKGTGDAVKAGLSELKDFTGNILILYGDVPLLGYGTLEAMNENHLANEGNLLTMLTAVSENPTGYGRIIRDLNDNIERVVEEKDATDEQRQITEINPGVYLAQSEFLKFALKRIGNKNKSGEFYLTDMIEVAYSKEKPAVGLTVSDEYEVMGVNDRSQLSTAQEYIRVAFNIELTRRGVTMPDSMNVHIDVGVAVGKDVTIMPGVHLRGKTTIEDDVFIDAGTVIENSIIKAGTKIKPYCHIEDSIVGENCILGPFAHLRPLSELKAGVHIGNFVETKKTVMGEGSKAHHLSYLGDANIGKKTNIGAGTITCNYDGEKKHQTTLGDEVFVGSDTQLVAPVKVGKGAYIGSGTTVTKDVPAGALAISRVPQKNIEGWVAKHKKGKK